MDYNNFEEEISAGMLAKGKSYFGAGAVSDLVKEDGHWLATVEGTEFYEVSVKGIKAIKEWGCDCPYDHGPICKHVVAVFYAVQDFKNRKGKSAASKKESPIDQIFKEVEADKLLAFFRKNLRRHKELEQQLLAEFIAVLNPNDESRFENLIDSIIERTAVGRYGQLDFRAGNQLSSAIERVLKTAEVAYTKKNYTDTFGITSAVLTKLPMTLLHVDDSNGSLQSTCHYAHEILTQLYTAPQIAPSLLDRIFDFVLYFFENDKSDYDDLRDDMIQTLLKQDWEESKLHDVEGVIQRVINNLSSEYSDYSKKRYLKFLINIAEQLGDNEKKNKIIEDNLTFSEIRLLKVNILLENEDYDTALTLINEGIEIAKQKKHPGTVSDWKKQLIRISRLKKDIKTERELLREAFYRGYNQMEYYPQLKATFDKEEWPTERETIIKRLSEDKSLRNNNNGVISQILITEKSWERLLALFKNKDYPGHLIETFGHHLHKKYPDEMLAFYKSIIIKFASEARSRSYYRQVARDLKKLLKINGGRAIVIELLETLKAKHANRPAMMDELSKVL